MKHSYRYLKIEFSIFLPLKITTLFLEILLRRNMRY